MLTVTVTDGGGETDTQTVTINVGDVDEADVTTPVDVNGAPNSVAENAALGTVVAVTAFATDADATTNAVTYAITGGSGASLFAIDSATGVVTVNGPINREVTGASVDIEVTATSADGSSKFDTFTIAVTDADEFDVGAITDSDSASNSLAENAAIGASAGITAAASDADATTSGITYSLDDSAGGRFAINATTGVVTLAAALDFEAKASHDIVVRATSQDGSFSTQTFTVAVTDLNDTAPVFTSASAVTIDEGTTAVLTLTATDADTVGDPVSFSITGAGADNALFEIVGGNQLRFKVAPNFEAPADAGLDGTYEVTVQATDGLNTTTQTLTVTVADVNEAPTAASLVNTTLTIAENTAVGGGIKVADVTVTDDALGTETLTLVGADASSFELRGTALYFIGASPDFEAKASYAVTVNVDDPTVGGAIDASAAFTLAVTNVNEAPVAGAPLAVSVLENITDTTVIATASSSDPDAGDSATYAITAGNGAGLFAINGSTGEIRLASGKALDRETAAQHVLTVTVTDGGGETDTQTVTINVGDVDEADVTTPTDVNGAPNSVAENAAIGTVVAVTAFASDADATTNAVTYAITGGSGASLFAIDSATGVVTVNGPINREVTGASVDIEVTATSATARASSTPLRSP